MQDIYHHNSLTLYVLDNSDKLYQVKMQKLHSVENFETISENVKQILKVYYKKLTCNYFFCVAKVVFTNYPRMSLF